MDLFDTNKLRKRSVRNSYSLDDDDVIVYNSSESGFFSSPPKTLGQRLKRCCLVITVFAVFVSILFCILYAYVPHLLDYDPSANIKIVKKDIDIEYQDSVAHYLNWDEYSSRWYPCLPIDKITNENGNTYFYLQKILVNDKLAVRHRVKIFDLVTAQITLIKRSNSYFTKVGNFTLPTMYMRHTNGSRNYFPCSCSIQLDGGKDSLDNRLKTMFDTDVLHMLNLVVNNYGNSDFADAKISMPMIRTFNDPFWMELPRSINVTFQLYNPSSPTGLDTTNILFYESVNVINILNCFYLSSVEWNAKWKWGQEVSLWSGIKSVV